MNILAISGSLRADSFNTKLARVLQSVAPSGMTVTVADISAIPLFNQDDEAAYPAPAQAFKDAIASADGVVIVTPEYNRSIPGVLKNALDWASRPYGQNSFAGKPVITMGVSGGKIGTAVAQNHLKQIFSFLDARIVGQPEVYLGPAAEVFAEDGSIAQESTRELLTRALTALSERVA